MHLTRKYTVLEDGIRRFQTDNLVSAIVVFDRIADADPKGEIELVCRKTGVLLERPRPEVEDSPEQYEAYQDEEYWELQTDGHDYYGSRTLYA